MRIRRHRAKKQRLVPVRVQTMMPKLSLLKADIRLLGCIMSVNAIFGHVYAKIQE